MDKEEIMTQLFEYYWKSKSMYTEDSLTSQIINNTKDTHKQQTIEDLYNLKYLISYQNFCLGFDMVLTFFKK